jgi:hypothetical protein
MNLIDLNFSKGRYYMFECLSNHPDSIHVEYSVDSVWLIANLLNEGETESNKWIVCCKRQGWYSYGMKYAPEYR